MDQKSVFAMVRDMAIKDIFVLMHMGLVWRRISSSSPP